MSHRNAFTLIELLVVIAVIVILLSISTTAFFGIKNTMYHHGTQGALRVAQSAMDDMLRNEGGKVLMCRPNYWDTWRKSKQDWYAYRYPDIQKVPPYEAQDGILDIERLNHFGHPVANLPSGTFANNALTHRDYLKRFGDELEDTGYLVRFEGSSNAGVGLMDAWGRAITHVAWSTHENSPYPASRQSYFVSAGRDGQIGDASPDDAETKFDGTDTSTSNPNSEALDYDHKKQLPCNVDKDEFFNKWEFHYSNDNLYSIAIDNK